MQAPACIDGEPDENSDSPENGGPDTYGAAQEAGDNYRRQEGGIGPKEKEGSP